jgi:HK97 family phage prohead protease
MALTFLLSDESVNSYGFAVKTQGIDLKRFKKNPVMLFNHERGQVIGKWENLRKQGGKLFADAVFSETTEKGREIAEQVRNGFLNAVSIGIEATERTYIDGIDTITKSVLNEVSIVDIPANENAVRHEEGKGENENLIYLSMQQKETKRFTKKQNDDFLKRTAEILGVQENEKEIILAVQELKQYKETVCELLQIDPSANADQLPEILKDIRKESETEKALKLGLITQSQYRSVLIMEKYDRQGFNDYMQELKANETIKTNNIIENCCRTGKIDFYNKGFFEDLAQKIGFKDFKKLTDRMHNCPRPSDLLKGVGTETEKKDLQWYRKNDPEKLKENPNLYRLLIEKDKETIK